MRLRTVISLLLLLAVFLAPQQAGTKPLPSASKDAPPTAKLRIELTGGDDNQPIPDASVYVKFQQNPKKNKQIELNLKTNQEGVALSPEIPQGRVLIQTIAPGWNTSGQWYDVSQAEQTIPIHLSRPTTHYY